jgi:predicted metal-dependent hydrolase
VSTNSNIILVANIQIEVVRKDIKNMHLAVYPPTGRIRLAAPSQTDSEVMRLFAISKLGWIKKHVRNFNEQPRETAREYKSGESHYFQGKRYLLNVIEYNGPNKVELKGIKYIQLYVKPMTTKVDKAIIIKEWYRKELKKQIPELIQKWEKIIGVKSESWGVKQMRTKWGACNIEDKRIWLNLELAKKPIVCLEYIIAHELVHLLERNHNERFVSHLNKHMPKWRQYRDELNRLPVAHNDWGY